MSRKARQRGVLSRRNVGGESAYGSTLGDWEEVDFGTEAGRDSGGCVGWYGL